MDHQNHVELLQKATIHKNEVWTDLGSGDGAFTLALRDLGGESIEIFSVDLDRSRLENQRRNFDLQFPNTNIHYVQKDFTQPLVLPLLDGIIMANSLHFVKDQIAVLKLIKKYLKEKAQLVLVEYNSDRGNTWVPYPISFNRFQQLAPQASFSRPQKLHAVSSDFMNEIYAALSYRQ